MALLKLMLVFSLNFAEFDSRLLSLLFLVVFFVCFLSGKLIKSFELNVIWTCLLLEFKICPHLQQPVL